jgi:hypothetical protein
MMTWVDQLSKEYEDYYLTVGRQQRLDEGYLEARRKELQQGSARAGDQQAQRVALKMTISTSPPARGKRLQKAARRHPKAPERLRPSSDLIPRPPKPCQVGRTSAVRAFMAAGALVPAHAESGSNRNPVGESMASAIVTAPKHWAGTRRDPSQPSGRTATRRCCR